jgi:hypothetical protein
MARTWLRCAATVARLEIGEWVVAQDRCPHFPSHDVLVGLPVLPEIDTAVHAVIGLLEPDLGNQSGHLGHHRGELLVRFDELGVAHLGDPVGNDLNVHGYSSDGLESVSREVTRNDEAGGARR